MQELTIPAPTANEVFRGYDERDLPLFEEFRRLDPKPKPEAGFVKDFFGTRMRTTSLWDRARENDGRVLNFPLPHDLYEAVEWIGLFKAMKSAGSHFTIMELGAGHGPWIAAGHQVAKVCGKTAHVVGVEADPGRYGLMAQNMADNGITSADLVNGAVGVEGGHARWPRIADPSNAAGARPVQIGDDGSADEGDVSYMTSDLADQVDVTIYSFESLLNRQPLWDLVHIDIQGWEHKIVGANLDLLSEKVRWILIGTHSRSIEGRLIDMLRDRWVLENDKPCQFDYRNTRASLEATTTIDGTQVWRNTATPS